MLSSVKVLAIQLSLYKPLESSLRFSSRPQIRKWLRGLVGKICQQKEPSSLTKLMGSWGQAGRRCKAQQARDGVKKESWKPRGLTAHFLGT